MIQNTRIQNIQIQNTQVPGGTYTGMGLGSTAKTLQRVADMGEELYSRLNEVRAQLKQLRETVGETNENVASLESEVAEQRAIIEALAENQGIDVDSVTAEVHIEEAEQTPGEELPAGESTDADAETAGEADNEQGEE